jgi:hypothetical protein
MKKGKRLMEHSSTGSLSLVVYPLCSTPHLIHHGNDNDRMVPYSERLPVFSIQIKVIMQSPSPTIHSCSFILPTCSVMMGHKDACNGYRLLQHRIHV